MPDALPVLETSSAPIAERLRNRMQASVIRRLESADVSPLWRRFALGLARRLSATTDAKLAARAIWLAARLEAAIPTSRRINRYLAAVAPDAVLTTGTF